MAELVAVIIVALATWQAVEICHHGSIFATLRARVETLNNWFSDLFLCPFCLSVWMAAILWILYHTQFNWPLGGALALPVYAFAISRVANLLNDGCHAFNRTPKDEL